MHVCIHIEINIQSYVTVHTHIYSVYISIQMWCMYIGELFVLYMHGIVVYTYIYMYTSVTMFMIVTWCVYECVFIHVHMKCVLMCICVMSIFTYSVLCWFYLFTAIHDMVVVCICVHIYVYLYAYKLSCMYHAMYKNMWMYIYIYMHSHVQMYIELCTHVIFTVVCTFINVDVSRLVTC